MVIAKSNRSMKLAIKKKRKIQDIYMLEQGEAKLQIVTALLKG